MSTFIKVPLATCEDYSILALSVMRAKGIPTIMDYTPQWPFRSMGHNWNVLIETSGKKVVYEGAGASPAFPHKEEHPMAKVFRKTYAINKDIEEIHGAEKHVPPAFTNICMKDVTEEYLTTCDISVDIDNVPSHQYAYLAVFDNANWVPVHWGKIKGKKVTFDRMGKRVVYLPVFYDVHGVQSFSDPVLLTVSGKQIKLTPDTLIKQTLVLKRKYSPLESMYEAGERIVGGRIQTASDPFFKDSVTLFTITDFGIRAGNIDLSHMNESARYWRYYPPDGAYCNIAELAFYEKDSIRPVTGKVIGTEGSYRKEATHTREAVFDGDILTFFDAPEHSDC